MANQLLIENAPFTLKLEESKDSAGNARYVVRGQFARSDKATENKRLYKEHLWKREIGRLNESMAARRAFGELDHPADGRTKLQRVSHLMTGLRVEGNEVVGEAEILDTPNGRILKSLFQAGAQVGVSSRGYGSTKSLPDGVEEVQEDFRLDTFDFVADPATKTAYPKVFQEELEHIHQAERDLTVESLKRDYPGLLKEIAESSIGDVAKAITEAESRAGERLKGTFQAQLRRVVESLAEDAYRKARSDLESDPEVAGAKQVLEQIVSIVSPFGMGERVQADMASKDQEIASLRSKLADRELEVQKYAREQAEVEKLAKRAGYTLHMERRVSDHPSKDTITKLIGDVVSYASIKEMDEKIEALLKEFKHVKPAAVEATERHDDLLTQIEALKTKVSASEEKAATALSSRDKALEQAREATKIAESFQIQLALEKKIGGRPDAARIRTLAESSNLSSEEDIEKLLRDIAMTPSGDLSSEQAVRIRERAQRGKASGLVEDTGSKKSAGNGNQGSGLLEQVGLSDEQFDKLTGSRPQ